MNAADLANMPAFPTTEWTADGEHIRECHGMTLRQHYAGLALQGLLSCPEVNGDQTYVAGWSVKYADALIAELARPVTL